MSVLRWLASASLLLLLSVAQAHTHLKDAVPAEGSTVSPAPERIELNFSAKARLTALSVQKEGAPQEQKLAPLPTESAAHISVPTPKLVPGKYTVNWRVVSADNHIMSGKLHFTVAGASASP